MCGDTYGGQNMKHVVALVEAREEPDVKVGTERPRRRTTRMSDVIIR